MDMDTKTVNACVNLVIEAAGGLLNQRQTGDLIRRVLEMTNTTRHRNANGTEEVIAKVNRYIKSQLQIEALKAKRNAMFNIAKVARVEKFVDNAFAMGEHREDAFVAYLIGRVDLISDKSGEILPYRNGVHQHQVQLGLEYVGAIDKQLNDAGVYKLYTSGKLSKEVFLELGAMTKEVDPVAEVRAKPRVSPAELLEAEKQGPHSVRNTESVTGIPEAKKIADILYDTRKQMIERHNLAGGLRDPNASYTVHQTHNAARILKAAGGDQETAYRMWRQNVIDDIDMDRTFDGVVDREAALREKFDMILAEDRRETSKGLRVGADGEEIAPSRKDDPVYFIRRQSLAKRGSKEKFITFKDTEAEWRYNEKYGSQSLNDSIMSEIMYYSQSTALMERLGPDPDGTFNAVMSYIKKQNIADGVSARQKATIKGILKEPIKAETAFKQVMGYLDTPGSATEKKIAKVARYLKLHQALSKLGSITIAAIADKPQMQFTLTYNGLSHADGLIANLKAFTKMSPSQKAFVQSLGVAADYTAAELNSRFSFYSGDIHAGVAHKLQDNLFKFGFAHLWNDIHKGATVTALMHHISHFLDVGLDALPQDLNHRFKQYGISAADWDVIRSAATLGEDGRMYIIPENIRKTVKSTTPDIVRKAQDVESKFRAYLTDQANDAVITPGARERIFSKMGTKTGTPAGEFIGLLTYFRSFPISITTRIIQREFKGFKGQLPRRFSRGVGLIASSALMGWVSGAIRDISGGKTPRTNWVNDDGSPNMALFMESLTRGGGLGFYGEFLTVEYDRSYRSFGKAALGPVYGSMAELFTLGQQTITGLASDDRNLPKAKAYTSFMKANTPYANLFYVKPVVDFIVLNVINETLDPGSARKYKRGLKNKTGQEFWSDDVFDALFD